MCVQYYISVIYNWNGENPYGLHLEIGDTVQILEQCCGQYIVLSLIISLTIFLNYFIYYYSGWYRGFVTKNRSVKVTIQLIKKYCTFIILFLIFIRVYFHPHTYI